MGMGSEEIAERIEPLNDGLRTRVLSLTFCESAAAVKAIHIMNRGYSEIHT